MTSRAIAVFASIIVCWFSTPSQSAEISCYVFYAGVDKQGFYTDRDGVDREGARKSWPSGRIPIENVTCLRGFLKGQIVKGDFDKVRAFLRANHPFLEGLVLNSPRDILWVDEFQYKLTQPPSIAEWENASCNAVENWSGIEVSLNVSREDKKKIQQGLCVDRLRS